MSGHSKWKNIMHKKEKTDSQRAKIFTKAGREISAAVKDGGADPAANSRLKDAISRAKSNNVPNDNIDRLIKKASGEDGSIEYFEITYEGFGPSGVAVIVETLTDNRNRTAGDMRHYFDKYGASLGQTGSVSWQFKRLGLLGIDLSAFNEEKATNDVLESGASDFRVEDGVLEVITEPDTFHEVQNFLDSRGYKYLLSEVRYEPENFVAIESSEDVKRMLKLQDALEENDDVQNVYHNWDEPEEE